MVWPSNLINAPLPDGWLGSTDNSTYSTITGDFPNKVGVGGALFNIGASGDRALGLGTTSASEQYELQLLVNVDEIDATSLQLQFDIEAWSINQRLADNPGEAAFGVTVDAKQEDAYVPLMDFGDVTTGVTLENRGSRVDGELDANHTSFDSGVVPIDLPPGTELRIRWTTPSDRPTTGWTYGLDNVRLGLGVMGVFGDLSGDGRIDVEDIDQLAREVWSFTGEFDSDLTGDGVVGQEDIDELLSVANRLRGDADFDGEVQFPDFLAISKNFGQSAATWSMGDFDADGEVQFPDFLILSQNFGKTIANVATVPEPNFRSQFILLLVMTLFGGRISRRASGKDRASLA